MPYGLTEAQAGRLGPYVMAQINALYACREQYAQKELPDYSYVCSACRVGSRWRIVTDCNTAFNMSGYTFYPHLCDNRPELAKAMANSICFWLNLRLAQRSAAPTPPINPSMFQPDDNTTYLIRWNDDKEEHVVSGKQLTALLHSWKKWAHHGYWDSAPFAILRSATGEDLLRCLRGKAPLQYPRDAFDCAKILGIALPEKPE